MAVYAATLNGSAVSIQPGWAISESANGRGRCDFTILSLDGSLWIANDDEFVLTEDGTRIFGGLVDRPATAGFGGSSASAATEQQASAADFNVYPSRVTVDTDTDRPSETLKARLTWIAGLMAAQGVTLDAGQVNGPTLDAASYLQGKPLVDVLNETTALASGTGSTSWVWNIDYSKVLSAIEAGTDAAPFNITDGDGNVLGDITVEQPRPSTYGNYIILLGGTGTRDVSDSFTGDGATATFQLTYDLSASYGYVTVAGIYETLGPGATWDYDPATNRITRTSPPALGAAIVVTYIGQFPKRVTADGGVAAADRVTKIYTAPDVFDAAVMQALADSYLTRDMEAPKTVRYNAAYTKTGLHPGQTQTIASTKRNTSGTHLLIDVRIVHVVGSLVQRQVTAVSTQRLPATLRERYQQTFAAGSGGGAAVSGVTIVTGGTFLQSPAFLGGTDRTPYVAPNPAAWTRVPSALPYVAPATMSVTLRAMIAARSTGITVTVRLYDETAGAAAFTGIATAIAAGGTPQEVTVSGTVTVGHKYHLEVLAGTNGEAVSALGALEAA